MGRQAPLSSPPPRPPAWMRQACSQQLSFMVLTLQFLSFLGAENPVSQELVTSSAEHLTVPVRLGEGGARSRGLSRKLH